MADSDCENAALAEAIHSGSCSAASAPKAGSIALSPTCTAGPQALDLRVCLFMLSTNKSQRLRAWVDAIFVAQLAKPGSAWKFELACFVSTCLDVQTILSEEQSAAIFRQDSSQQVAQKVKGFHGPS